MAAVAVPAAKPPHPVAFEVEYPERQSRWKALLRLPLAIPVLIFSYLLSNGVVLAIVAAVLVRSRIPYWLFEFQAALNRWHVRALSYLLLLSDVYPPFEGTYPVRYELQYPEHLSRWKLVVWKIVTAIPHLIVLWLLMVTLVPVTVIAWVAILITGRYPRTLHGYTSGVLRWGTRVQAYLISLTDEFPPFSLSPHAGAGGTPALAISTTIGVLAIAGGIAGVTAWVMNAGQEVAVQVSYQRLLAGEVTAQSTRAHVISATVGLTGATDPADQLFPVLQTKPGHRLVQFELAIEITRPGDDVDLKSGQFSLEDANGDTRDALLAIVGGRVTPVTLKKHDVAEIVLLFEVPQGVAPAELRYDVLNYIDGPRVGETIVYKFQ